LNSILPYTKKIFLAHFRQVSKEISTLLLNYNGINYYPQYILSLALEIQAFCCKLDSESPNSSQPMTNIPELILFKDNQKKNSPPQMSEALNDDSCKLLPKKSAHILFYFK